MLQLIRAKFQLIIKISLAIFFAAIFFVIGFFVSSILNQDSTRWRQAVVDRVVDGDTIVLSSGERIRYLDIDTPETVHPQKPVECYGLEATKKNEELVKNKKIYIDVPNISKDKYGRTLAYVYTNNYFVNGELVYGGYAFTKSYGQPGMLYQTLIQIERLSRENNQGLWKHCKF